MSGRHFGVGEPGIILIYPSEVANAKPRTFSLDITVNLRSDVLRINYTDEAVYMTGGAETVFEGEVEV